MQCMMGAMGIGAGATGTRAFIATRHFSWLTPRRLRAITATLLTGALLASATLVSGSTPHPTRAAQAPAPSAAHSAR